MAKQISTHALAAKQLRKELKGLFPSVKFSVTTKTYSGGDSLTVSWDNGVCVEKVRNILDKYQYGTFNGMTDSYEYNNKEEDVSQVKFTFTNRTITDDLFLKFAKTIAKDRGYKIPQTQQDLEVSFECDNMYKNYYQIVREYVLKLDFTSEDSIKCRENFCGLSENMYEVIKENETITNITLKDKKTDKNKSIEKIEKSIISLNNQKDKISLDYDLNITRRRAAQLENNRYKYNKLKDYVNILNGIKEKLKFNDSDEILKQITSKLFIELIFYGKFNYKRSEYDHANERNTKTNKSLNKLGFKNNEEIEKYKDLLKELIKPLTPAEIKQKELKELENSLIGSNIPGFYPTPKTIKNKMLENLQIKETDKILEPSAGKGDLADGLNCDCIEQNYTLQKILSKKGHNVVESDFLNFDINKKYDKIIMNPPFENLQDIDHIKKAYEHLNNDGVLCCIMGAGGFFRNDKKAVDFRNWLDSNNGYYEKLEQGAFIKSFNSTSVQTYMVTIEK